MICCCTSAAVVVKSETVSRRVLLACVELQPAPAAGRPRPRPRPRSLWRRRWCSLGCFLALGCGGGYCRRNVPGIAAWEEGRCKRQRWRAAVDHHAPDAERLPCARTLRHAGWQRQSKLRFTASGAEGERFALVGGVGCKRSAGIALETEGDGGKKRLQLLGSGGGQRAKGHGVMVQPHLKTDVRKINYN